MKHRVDVAHLEAAWHWVLRLRDEQATAEDLAAWLQWYEADECHRRAFDEMQSFWHEFGQLTHDDEDASSDALLARRPPNRATPVRSRWWRHGLPALAASVLVATVASAWMKLSTAPEPMAPIVDVRETWLPDGSTVALAAKSNVSSQYSEQLRLLVMQGESGEAFFSVARNPQRPFVVEVGAMRVRALGTAFNVRRAENRIVVSVTEGVVEISVPQGAAHSDTGGTIKVAAGNRIVWEDSADAVPSIAPATAASTLAWRQGRLEYHNEPLAAVIADVNRYSKRTIVIEDAAAGDILFSGTVFTRATDAWIDALPQVFPVRIEARLLGGLSLHSSD